MPRQNPIRDIRAESDLAQRIAWERERRGWTNEGLASRLTAAGCPIQPSAIYKIEKGDPPRRITVNELVAMANVFGLPVTDLLQSPDAVSDPWVGHLVNKAEVALRELNAVVGEMEQLLIEDPHRRQSLKAILREFFGDWPELRNLYRWALRGESHFDDQPKPTNRETQS